MTDRGRRIRKTPAAVAERARRAQAAAQQRIEGTWVQDIIDRLKLADVVNATTLFGSSLLLSVLPLIIVLSSFADEKIDDDISRHIGLSHEGAGIVHGLFRARPAHDTGTVVLAVLMGLVGAIATVQFLQEVYERIFRLERRGWRHLWRFVVVILVFMFVLLTETAWAPTVHRDAGPLAEGAVALIALTAFFTWTMAYLLGGRIPWRRLLRAGFLTALFWIVMAFASSFLFSSTLVSDSHLYGTIGVVFTLLTWFLAIATIIVLGAVTGAVWDDRHERAKVRPSRD